MISKIYISSNIPQGYGLGSSGALIAAVYEKYAISKLFLVIMQP